METFRPLCNYLIRIFSKVSRIDGRFVVLGGLVVYFSIILIGSLFTDYYKVWKLLGGGTTPPPFLDLRVILAGFECTRLGYDPLITNPCDIAGRQMNYPRIWMALTPLGLDQSDVIFLGIAFACIFYSVILSIIGRLNYGEAILYLVILFSPPVVLLVDRANNDIIIFSLLSICLICCQFSSLIFRFIGYSLILLSAFLKLYPIVAIAAILRESKKTFIALIMGFSAVFFTYTISNLEEIKAVGKATPAGIIPAYGYKVIFRWLEEKLSTFIEDVVNSSSVISLLNFTFFIKKFLPVVLAIATFASGAFITYKLSIKTLQEFQNWLKRERPINNESQREESSIALDSFRLGWSIYFFTFILGNNWDYRLAFLILTVPQLLKWIKENNQLSLGSSVALIGTIATLYLSKYGKYTIVDEVINWLLLGYLTYCFTLSLPEWLKLSFHRVLSNSNR